MTKGIRFIELHAKLQAAYTSIIYICNILVGIHTNYYIDRFYIRINYSFKIFERKPLYGGIIKKLNS